MAKVSYASLKLKTKTDVKTFDYEGNTIEQKIVRFCKDIKIKVYRFKRIIENKPKCYFMSDEIIRIMKKLKIQENKIAEFFFKEI